ncbi:MAG: hypothetical protein IPI69_02355 [Bacteroidales bacterium]|nr:hypothetical protein [Bacteroidales bacterium]
MKESAGLASKRLLLFSGSDVSLEKGRLVKKFTENNSAWQNLDKNREELNQSIEKDSKDLESLTEELKMNYPTTPSPEKPLMI